MGRQGLVCRRRYELVVDLANLPVVGLPLPELAWKRRQRSRADWTGSRRPSHFAPQYQYDAHPEHLRSGLFVDPSTKQASHRRPFSDGSRTVDKGGIERMLFPGRKERRHTARPPATGWDSRRTLSRIRDMDCGNTKWHLKSVYLV